APHALAHDLAGAERVAGIEDVPLADVPAVDANPFGEDVHHPLHGELRLVAAEAAHRAGIGIVGVDSSGFDVHVRNPVHAGRMAGGAECAFRARRVVTAGVGDDP